MNGVHKNTKLAQSVEKNMADVELEFNPIVSYKEGAFIPLWDCLVNYPALTLNDRLVYSAIRAFCQMKGSFGISTATNQTIANRLGISRGSVSRSITKLQSLGIITIGSRRHGSLRALRICRDFKYVQPEQTEWENSNDEYEEDDYWGPADCSADDDNDDEDEYEAEDEDDESEDEADADEPEESTTKLHKGKSVEELMAYAHSSSNDESLLAKISKIAGEESLYNFDVPDGRHFICAYPKSQFAEGQDEFETKFRKTQLNAYVAEKLLLDNTIPDAKLLRRFVNGIEWCNGILDSTDINKRDVAILKECKKTLIDYVFIHQKILQDSPYRIQQSEMGE